MPSRNDYLCVLVAVRRKTLSDNDVHQKNDIVNRLILDIKALVLLSENDPKLTQTVHENVLGSHDRGQFLTALGGLVLTSFLTIAGLSLLAPSLMGLQSPDQLLSYFKEIVSGISANSFSNPLIPLLDFLFALILLLGAFYLLRHTSVDLKQAGFSE